MRKKLILISILFLLFSLSCNTVFQRSAFADALTYDQIAVLPSKKICWGQGRRVDDKNRPVDSIGANKNWGKYDAIFIGEDKKVAYLTFDQGYENGCTQRVLDILKEKNVKGVFFVTYDYAKRNPDLIKKILEDGHKLGNHSMKHACMPSLSIEQAQTEILDLHNYIYSNFGYTMNLFRPPRGEFSEKSLAITQALKYKTIFWSFAYADWEAKKNIDPTKALQRITSSSHDGAIYLFHTVNEIIVKTLPATIDDLKSKGYEIMVFE